MEKKMGSANDGRTDSRQKLESLLGSRKDTLALYTELAGLRPFEEETEVKVVLQEFCESLMDYTASAHFQLYRFIEEGIERRARVRDVAEKVYPEISATTQTFLDFNDKYDSEKKIEHLATLADDLSNLGEILADRIVYEDQVISAFTTTKSRVA
jgi:regulator of sigma D